MVSVSVSLSSCLSFTTLINFKSLCSCLLIVITIKHYAGNFDRYMYILFFTIRHLSNACFPRLLFADVAAIAQETFLS